MECFEDEICFTSAPAAERSRLEESTENGLVGGCERDHQYFQEEHKENAVKLEPLFLAGTPMRPEELLLYALMRLSFKTYTFTKYHSISHYQRMVLVIKKICGVDFSASSIRRFFPKVSSNHLKANIGKENGVVRWRCFKSQIDRFIQVSENDLEYLLNNAESTPESVVFSMLQNLRSICILVVAGSAGNFEIMLQIECDFANQFHAIVKPYLSTTSNWSQWFNSETASIHIYQFGLSPGYAEKEIKISKTFDWSLYVEGIERQKSHLNLLKEVPDSVISVASLAELLKLIDECRICDGCGNIEQFAEVLLDGGNSIFKKGTEKMVFVYKHNLFGRPIVQYS